MKEIWKDISDYEGIYQISNLGNVKSLNYNHTNTSKMLSPKKHKNGYLTVTLCKNGVNKNKSIHVLVASEFLENSERFSCVNHIDGNKENNNVSNLEWVTYSQNTRHAIKIGLRSDSNMKGKTGSLSPLKKAVNQFSKDGKFIKTWDCISDAEREFGCSPSTVINCCTGRIKSCKGYIWEYADV